MINSFITSQALSSKAEVFKVAFVSDLKTDFKLLCHFEVLILSLIALF